MNTTPPTTYRIAEKAPVFPCWCKRMFKIERSGEWDFLEEHDAFLIGWYTHWCHSLERPTHDPTAPATPATAAAKGGDIPRTPTDSEMLDWLENAQFTYHPGEIAPCPACNSRGGDYWCSNDSCESGVIWRIFSTKERAIKCAKANTQSAAPTP